MRKGGFTYDVGATHLGLTAEILVDVLSGVSMCCLESCRYPHATHPRFRAGGFSFTFGEAKAFVLVSQGVKSSPHAASISVTISFVVPSNITALPSASTM
jgi:hypothetical protein